MIILLTAGIIPHKAFAAQETGCICNDGSVQYPYCGICGTDAGTMERNEDGTGVICLCDGKLKAGEASCADACAKNNGWSGDFDE